MEIRLILTRLLFAFDLELLDESKDWFKRATVIGMWQKPELMIKVTPV